MLYKPKPVSWQGQIRRKSERAIRTEVIWPWLAVVVQPRFHYNHHVLGSSELRCIRYSDPIPKANYESIQKNCFVSTFIRSGAASEWETCTVNPGIDAGIAQTGQANKGDNAREAQCLDLAIP